MALIKMVVACTVTLCIINVYNVMGQDCQTELSPKESEAIDQEAKTGAVTGNGYDPSEDLVAFFSVVQDFASENEFEIFMPVNNASKIVYDINNLSEDLIGELIKISCSYSEDTERKVILRFFSFPDKNLLKIYRIN